jgi:hypothetical protein
VHHADVFRRPSGLAVPDDLDDRYLISRGLAKSGSKQHHDER